MPIHLTVAIHIRLISYLIYALGYLLAYLIFPADYLYLGLILWTWMILRGLFYAPEMSIYPEGIETRRLFWRHFLRWDEISTIRFGEGNSTVYLKALHPIVKSFLYSNLLINGWRGNYKEAIAYMKSQFAERNQAKGKRAYE